METQIDQRCDPGLDDLRPDPPPQVVQTREINLAPPPRLVPASVAANALFGGFNSSLGFGLASAGVVVACAATLFGDVVGWYQFAGPLDHAEARVTAINKTMFSEGGSDHADGTPVYSYDYAYTDARGTQREGRSYSTGKGWRYKAGHLVTIEFPSADPSLSRIVGMRHRPFGQFALIFLAAGIVVVAVGAGFAFAGLRDGGRAIALLRQGQLAHATCCSKRPTSIQINNRRVFRLTFAFTDEDGLPHEVVCKTHMPDAIEDEPREPLLYLPTDPDCAMLWDAMPGGINLRESGQVQPVHPVRVAAALFLPALLAASAVAGAYALFVGAAH